MPGELYKGDPLTPEEREEFESDLISFCDWELDLLGDIRGLDILYAGGTSPLWIEGLSQRIGSNGSLATLDNDAESIEKARGLLAEAEPGAPVQLVCGDVFEPPFAGGAFDLIYSAGLFHELDVAQRSAEEALSALAYVVRPGGRVATSDFVDSTPAVQLEDEALQKELAREAFGEILYGIGPPERLVALHEAVLADVKWHISPSYPIRHLGRVVLAEDKPAGKSLPPFRMERLRQRYDALRERIRHEGYTRPATLFVEGIVPGS